MNDDTLTIEESRTLIKLCQAGKLYEIETWIASGKSLRTPPGVKKPILSIALTTEFHSLIELIARNEPDQEIRNEALAQAISQRRWELVEVLLRYGAELTSVPFIEVLRSWDPKMIRFFLDNGADAISGDPFAVAFGERIRTALRPFVDYKPTHPEIAGKLQEQLDRALRHFAGSGDLKWVSLLMWAGGNPRSRGRDLHDQEDDPECYSTALEAASSQDNAAVLKRLKPDPRRDNLSVLLNCACHLSRKEIVKYIFELGANPNDKANGGSTGLDNCLGYFRFADMDAILHGYKRLTPKYVVCQTLDCIRELIEHGAIWKPDGNTEMNRVRRALYEMEPDVTLELLKMFVGHQSCLQETMNELLNPRMKEHLVSCEKQLLRLGLDIRSKKDR